eukprot:GFYU01031151.1.p1 GENE.GFYU01031151.1~~GFYU01031151.1.p1  ORF type:complete len:560 (-),score=135.32 GFYU01031151.1:71-1699(-)
MWKSLWQKDTPLLGPPRTPSNAGRRRQLVIAGAASVVVVLLCVGVAEYFTCFSGMCKLYATNEATTKAVTDYDIDFQMFANPGRGFYKHFGTYTPDYTPLDATTLTSIRTDQKFTIILRLIYLNAFAGNITVSSPISDAVLQNIKDDFATLRKVGMKAVLRFAYAKPEIPHDHLGEYGDSDLGTCKMHIDQLSPILKENSDIIAILQFGFIGQWGEGSYTDYFGLYPTDSDWDLRHQLLSYLLAATDSQKTKIQVRTPQYKLKTIGDAAITKQECDTQADNCRVGFHNDCFLSSDSDWGTWKNKDVEYPYVKQQSQYIPSGGEVCHRDPPRSQCGVAQEEMAMFHYTYLNRDYNVEVLNDWINVGKCFDKVAARLGYYFYMTKAAVETAWKGDQTYQVGASFVNAGYSAPLAGYKLHVVFRQEQQSGGLRKAFVADLSSMDGMYSREWMPDTTVNVAATFNPNSDMTDGKYGVYVWLVDESASLKYVPQFSVEFDTSKISSAATWDAAVGMNKIGVLDFTSGSTAGSGGVDLVYDATLSAVV